ncbi:hypothetical protein [Thermoanaerobacterium sp. RBIITD]|uniref:hypothetical protein n=1 Tax=Thermoanaerobacterium sp. RBIITD TaxID=1550240 RepID=UPI000BB6C129|nr:hypothetical protein [Thermoanaerobacterium sp. RBIITD]SNX53234.1 hypothetical protein SAMN05660242_0737 [Thermoanaerobacterium sp. RBIITD]
MIKKLVSLLLVAVLFTISSFSFAFAVPTSNVLPRILSIDAEQKSTAEYDRFLKDVDNFKKFIQAQKPNQGSLSDDAFLLKCAIKYHNQKVSNGELEGPLLDLNEAMDLKASSSQVTIQSAGITKSFVRAQL